MGRRDWVETKEEKLQLDVNKQTDKQVGEPQKSPNCSVNNTREAIPTKSSLFIYKDLHYKSVLSLKCSLLNDFSHGKGLKGIFGQLVKP